MSKGKKTYTDRLKKKLKAQPEWTPFEIAPLAEDYDVHDLNTYGVPWVNSRWQVWIRKNMPTGFPDPNGGEGCMMVTHLSIKRHDRDVVLGKDWRDFQRIKNELCGEDCEAMEIYPAEDRLVDTANQYHLWVLPPGLHLPLGYSERLVAEQTRGEAKQRSFEDDAKPEDLKTEEELMAMGKEMGLIS